MSAEPNLPKQFFFGFYGLHDTLPKMLRIEITKLRESNPNQVQEELGAIEVDELEEEVEVVEGLVAEMRGIKSECLRTKDGYL